MRFLMTSSTVSVCVAVTWGATCGKKWKCRKNENAAAPRELNDFERKGEGKQEASRHPPSQPHDFDTQRCI